MAGPLHFLSALLLLFLLTLCPVSFCLAAPGGNLRIICLCDGSHPTLYNILAGIAHALKDQHLIVYDGHFPSGRDVRELWLWLAAHTHGRISFLADGFYMNTKEDTEERKVLRGVLERRMNTLHDVDLVLAFGTRAGQELRKITSTVPVIVTGATDATSAGLSIPERKPNDNLIAVVNPGRFKRQVEFFQTLFNFHTLGIVYSDSATDRSIAALSEIESACREGNVQLVRCHGHVFQNPDPEKMVSQMEACHRMFAKKAVDAVYITYHSLRPEDMKRVLLPLNNAGIPTLSQAGPEDVEAGVLASVSSFNTREGRFVAKLISHIADGVPPASLSPTFTSEMRLAVNLHTAALIGWNPSLDVLLNVDSFYRFDQSPH